MNNTNTQDGKLPGLFLLAFAVAIGGSIGVNIHDLAHIKCGAAGECFGAGNALNQLSLLPLWLILLSAISCTLLLISSILLLAFRRQDIVSKHKKVLLKLMVTGLVSALLASGLSFWLISKS